MDKVELSAPRPQTSDSIETELRAVGQAGTVLAEPLRGGASRQAGEAINPQATHLLGAGDSRCGTQGERPATTVASFVGYCQTDSMRNNRKTKASSTVSMHLKPSVLPKAKSTNAMSSGAKSCW